VIWIQLSKIGLFVNFVSLRGDRFLFHTPVRAYLGVGLTEKRKANVEKESCFALVFNLSLPEKGSGR